MPNGHDKNWVRLYAAIEGFRVRYGRPTEVRIDPMCLQDLRTCVFSERAWRVIEENLAFHAVGEVFEVTGAEGERYSYMEEGFPPRSPDVRAEEWIGVTPDRH